MQNDELLPVTQALRLEGFNGAISQAVRALRYLADHDRPSNGEQFPNSASCHMVADELELTMQLFEPAIAAWNTRAAPSGEGRSNGAGEDDLRLARGTVEAYLVERLRGEGYGPARRIIDARKYDPTSDDYWVNAEAKNNHRVTPLAALSAPQGDVERLREAIQQALQCTPRIKINGVSKGITQHKIVYDCGDPWEILRAALAQPEAGGE